MTFAASAATGTFASPDAASGITVQVAGITFAGTTQDGTLASVDYTLTQPTTTATISQATLTVTGITANNKPYDGTPAATLNTSSAVLHGVVSADTATVTFAASAATGTFASPDVGPGITVQVAGITFGGTTQDGTLASVDYALTQPTTTATISQATLTVTGITANNKPYDGTPAATLNTGGAVLHGVVSGDTGVTSSAAAATGTFASPDVGPGIVVQVAGITFGGTTQDGTLASVDYMLTQPTTTANISQATLTVTGITANNKPYDGTDAATLNTGGAVLHGVVSGDMGTVTFAASAATGTFASPDAAPGITVQVAGITFAGTTHDGTLASVDYTLTQPTTTATISQATLTVTGITANNKPYDGTPAATLNTASAVLHGVVSGDTGVTFSAAAATGTFATPDVGPGIVVQVAGITFGGRTQDGTLASVDYMLTQPTTTATISQATLTVTGITANNKPYDGTDAATLNTGGAVLHGVVSGDMGTVTFAASAATGTFASPDAAPGITVQVAGITFAGTTHDGTLASVDYTLTQPTTTATISQATLTVTGITANNKPYDGTPAATLNTASAVLHGVVSGDTGVTFSAAAATGTFASPDVGPGIVVQVAGITFGGRTQDGTLASVDYMLTQPTTTANISQATLTVTGITANNKPYDGTTAATLNAGGAVLHGVVGGDTGVTFSAAAATGTFASPDVGPGIVVQVAGITFGGRTQDGTLASVDYMLTQPTTTANISQATLTVTGITANNKPYDGTPAATLNTASAVLHGVVSGDTGTVTFAASAATGTFASPDAAPGIVVQVAGITFGGTTQDGTLASVDYTLTQPTTTATISQATLTVTGITANNKPYDGTTAATLNTSSAVLHGVVSGDTATVTFAASAATGTFASPDAAPGITVQVAGVTFGGTTQDGTAASVDYTLTQPTTTATISQATLTVTGITANNKPYDGTTAATLNTGGAVLHGVVSGDTGMVTFSVAGATGTFASPDAASGIVVQVAGITFGGTTQDGTAASVDYTLTQPTTTATISQATLTVTGITANNKPYDGTPAATLNTGGAVLHGVVSGDTGIVTFAASAATGTFASPDAASGIVVQVAGITFGGTTHDGTAASVDYTLTQPTTTATISQATLTVTGITANNKPYDGTTAATLNTGGAVLHGVVSGDTGTVRFAASAATGTFASPDAAPGITVQVAGITFGGTTQDGTAASVDYTLTQPTTTANISQAASVTTTVGAGPFTYTGSAQIGGSGTVTGAGGLSTTATSLTYSANSDGTGVADQTDAGTYYVTAHYAGDANHTASDGAAVAIVIQQAAPAATTVGAGPFTGATSASSLLAIGPDVGLAPEVKVFTATGVLRFDFFAYNPAFTGGVRVAVGDVNGDGVPDIITGPGPGMAPEIKVFDGVTGQVLYDFYAFNPAFTGGIFVAAGDVNGDGSADIIVGAGAGGAPEVKVFGGGSLNGEQLRDFFAFEPTFTGGVRVAAGDVNGDGYADIIVGRGPGGPPEVKVFSVWGNAVLFDFYAFDAGFIGGVYVAAGDVNGDGRADLIVGAGLAPDVRVFNGATGAKMQDFFAFDPRFQGGARVAAVAVNGHADLVIGAGVNGAPEVRVLDALSLQVLDNFFAFDPALIGGVFVG